MMETKCCHIFIDGSHFFCQSAPGGIFSFYAFPKNYRSKPFFTDFSKLINTIISITQDRTNKKVKVGELYYSTAIFTDFPLCSDNSYCLEDHAAIKRIESRAYAKQKQQEAAKNAGFNTNGVCYVKYKPWLHNRLINNSYKEKEVDQYIGAYLTRCCVTNPNDYFVLVAGDRDFAPIVKIFEDKKSQFFLATTRPYQWRPEMQQSSSELINLFSNAPFFLEDYVKYFMAGSYVNQCCLCKELFAKKNPLPIIYSPICSQCRLESLKQQEFYPVEQIFD